MINVADIPDYTLNDVYTSVYSHNTNVQNNLASCFTYAVNEFFDTRYNNDTYNGSSLQGMKRFRNYTPKATIVDPDYLVLKYTWGIISGGRDLDTATEFSISGISGLTNQPIGWHLGSNVINILKYGGDNTTSGNETAFIDLTVLTNSTNNPNLVETSKVDIYANWYGGYTGAQCTIELKAYKGGTMSLSGTTWINTGGTLLSTQSFNKTVNTEGSANVLSFRTAYTYLGYISYTKSTKTAVLNF